ncbi:MAG TPA: hypothetical protein VMW80_00955 [Candidatus Dormibacteraeota bacterium]|nr:hypothetical protein [Candidatus Dormibacteraeota bacterium]
MTDPEDETQPTGGGFEYVPSDDGEPTNPLEAALDAFSQQQRLLASFDFSALSAAQSVMADIAKMHNDLAKTVLSSVNFGHLQETTRAITAAASLAPIARIDNTWLEQLSKSLDFSAITRANELILNNAAFSAASQIQRETFASISRTLDYSALTEQLSSVLQGIDWGMLTGDLDNWLPENLREGDELEEVARLALEEGLPLAWVPRAEFVHSLVNAKSKEERSRILSEHLAEILDDCDAVLNSIDHDWASQCRSAIVVLRQPGLEAPAQSHAGNILDSIVLATLGGKGRDEAARRASAPYDDLPLRVAVENLVLRPLFLGFAQWWPAHGDPIPGHFARHATAHAVGQPGVFTRENALIAVMLATSLTVQFWQDAGAPPTLGAPAP